MYRISFPIRDFSSGPDPNRLHAVRYLVVEARGEDEDEILENISLDFKSSEKIYLRRPSDVGKNPKLLAFLSSEEVRTEEAEMQTDRCGTKQKWSQTDPCIVTPGYFNSDGELEPAEEIKLGKRKKAIRSERRLKAVKREEKEVEDEEEVHCINAVVHPMLVPKSESSIYLAQFDANLHENTGNENAAYDDYYGASEEVETMEYAEGGEEENFAEVGDGIRRNLEDGEFVFADVKEELRTSDDVSMSGVGGGRGGRVRGGGYAGRMMSMPALSEYTNGHNDDDDSQVVPPMEMETEEEEEEVEEEGGGEDEDEESVVDEGKAKCTECGKQCSSARDGQYLKLHYTHVHSSNSPYSCPQCHEYFFFFTQAKTHISKCSKGAKVVVNPLKEAEETIAVQRCFPRFFREHSVSYDPSEMRDCARCGEGVHVDHRAVHIVRAHREEVVWTCAFCEKVFVDEAHRVHHIDVDHPEGEMTTGLGGTKMDVDENPQEIVESFFPP